FDDQSYDAITALSVMQYVVDLDHMLHECVRVLRPGGQFIVCVPNMRAVWRLAKLLFRGDFPRTSLDDVGIDGGTVHYFTTRSAGGLLKRHRFDVMNVRGVFCAAALLEHRLHGGAVGWLKREFSCAEVLLDCRVIASRNRSRG